MKPCSADRLLAATLLRWNCQKATPPKLGYGVEPRNAFSPKDQNSLSFRTNTHGRSAGSGSKGRVGYPPPAMRNRRQKRDQCEGAVNNRRRLQLGQAIGPRVVKIGQNSAMGCRHLPRPAASNRTNLNIQWCCADTHRGSCVSSIGRSHKKVNLDGANDFGFA
jgi:hypothetical protein